MSTDLLSQIGRRVRVGLVGGGKDSVIGRTHLIAMRTDGLYDVVAGAMSIDPEIAKASARAELIDEDRAYTDFRVMAEREAAREDRIDAVVIATPPQLHYEVARVFMEKGIDVICEKPLTRDLAEAQRLNDLVKQHDRLFLLTHCYTGYPMVREARAIVASGALGKIQCIEGELCAGFVVDPANPDRHWRFRESAMGKGVLLGEVGSHAHHIVSYITGLRVEQVSAEMTTFAEGREVYDNAYLTARFEGGARGRLWGSYVATGNDHGLSFRIFGEKGSLTWVQEEPEVLWFKPPGAPAQRLARGYASNSPQAAAATRFTAGHPEGYALAFANLYSDFAKALMAKRLELPYQSYLDGIPGIEDGVDTMSLIDAAVRSAEHDGAWTTLTR
ncbi:Gfo/Idh/MocA family oxidoreductase [Caballeronia sp. GAFFF1]|uniref:Gfo/Idh/MocA family protein n=1 Tax=Caballeronia sp. GAFFF1 TaxID=2921779 RepID=UPI002028B929|nr:Gfo/Idh/MocA family oxidoreductase [Caballeronia sp. GAFFF1]